MPDEFEVPETPESPESRKERAVGLIIAVIAVVLAIVTHIGNELHQDEGLSHTDAADQYNDYQQKKMSALMYDSQSETLSTLAPLLPADKQSQVQQIIERNTKNSHDTLEHGEEHKKKGDELVDDAHKLARKSSILDIGEIALQISVVICSLTILTEQRLFVRLGVAIAAVGVAIAAWVLIFMA